MIILFDPVFLLLLDYPKEMIWNAKIYAYTENIKVYPKCPLSRKLLTN